MPQQAFDNFMDAGREAKADPLQFLKDRTGISDIQALTLPPEEYAKYLAENGGTEDFRAPPIDMPPLQPYTVPYAPTGGFVNQTPNYLNFAQQSLGGPYG